jgi:predicted N-acetyltransferase YhbS
MVDAVSVREVRPEDGPQISALHARAFGPGRFARTAYRIREGSGPFSRYCRVCLLDKRIIAALRFTPIRIGGTDGALLLGPLAVDPEFANRGHGRGLVREGMDAARAEGLALVLLVGDEPYYARLGFVRVPPGQIALPGPVDPQRLLAAELRPGALSDYRGWVTAAVQP